MEEKLVARDNPHGYSADDLEPLSRAAAVALSDARKRRTGLRGWKASRLDWGTRYPVWDSDLECFVVTVTARPTGQAQAPQAEWEYWLDNGATILPGFPVVGNLPDWDKAGAAYQEDESASATPTKWDVRIAIASLVFASAVVIASLGWMATG